MPSVTAISSGVRPPHQSPCMTPGNAPARPTTQLSLQSFFWPLALKCGFTGSVTNTYVCSCTSVRVATYRYEHMFPRSTPSPLTRRARNALSLARSFLLLEDDYDVDWEVDQDESGQDRSKIDGISDRPARGRRDATGDGGGYPDMPDAGRRRAQARHPHRASLRRRSARERAGQPLARPHVCLSPVSPPTVSVSDAPGADGRIRGDRAPRRRDRSASSSSA
jgi:hypothetical protein